MHRLARNLGSKVVGADSNMGGVDSSKRSVGNSMTNSSIGGSNSGMGVGTIGSIEKTSSSNSGIGVGTISSIGSDYFGSGQESKNTKDLTNTIQKLSCNISAVLNQVSAFEAVPLGNIFLEI